MKKKSEEREQGRRRLQIVRATSEIASSCGEEWGKMG